jgi:hypothetical protein
MPDRTTTSPAYTAAQIAQALGSSRRGVRRALAGVPAQVRLLDGQETKCWRLDQLPACWRERMEAAAAGNGYNSVAGLLTSTDAKWEPVLSLRDCAESASQRALKLRDALATPLTLRNDRTVSRTELEAIGLRDYQAVFRHKVTARHWWRLFERTLERAGAGDDFHRLELYLDEQPALKREAESVEPETLADGPFFHVDQTLARCHDPNHLNEEGRRLVWNAALELWNAQVEAATATPKAKADLLAHLFNRTPSLAPSREALRKAFDRRFARWMPADNGLLALKDKRADANRARMLPLNRDDLDLLTIYTVEVTGARISQAWRECVRDGFLSSETTGRFLCNPASKSHVPTVVRNAIKHDVDMLFKEARRPKHTRDNGAWIDRCWDRIPALSWYCADDCTLPVYYRIPDGKGWWTLVRGQFLLMICARTTCVLGFALMPERNYNARVIRTLCTRTFDEHGLPRRGFYFENGIWKSSRILKGAQGEAALEWDQVELGLCEFGLRFIHAKRARSKPVERVLGALQNYMEGDPGYAGRDERRDPVEHFQRAKLLLESRKIDPERFYTQDQWVTRLDEVCQLYNAEPQGGKHTRGLSPDDALSAFRSTDDPPVKPDASWRYLLAHHKRAVRVTANGITLRFGKQVFNYKNEHTGTLRGQTMLAWFDPETPEVLAVTDLDRLNPFCVARSQSPDAIIEPDDEAGQALLAQERGRCEAHMSYARTRYRILKQKHAHQVRRSIVSPAVASLGVEIERQKLEVRTQTRTLASARRVAREVGIDPESVRRPEQLDDLRDFQRSLSAFKKKIKAES